MDNLAAWQQFAKSFGSKILIGCYFGKNHKCLEHIFWFSFEKAWIVFSSKNTIFFSSLATRCRWQHGGACKTFFKPKVLGTGLLVMQTLSLTSCLSRCGQKETTMSSLGLKPPGWCKYLQAFQDIQQLVARCFLLFPAETPSWFHGSPFMILAQPHDNKCYILSPNLSSCVVMMVAWWGRQDFFCQINAAKFVTLWLWFVYNNELTQTRNNPSKKGVIWHPEKTENNGTQAISLPPADGLLFFSKRLPSFPRWSIPQLSHWIPSDSQTWPLKKNSIARWCSHWKSPIFSWWICMDFRRQIWSRPSTATAFTAMFRAEVPARCRCGWQISSQRARWTWWSWRCAPSGEAKKLGVTVVVSPLNVWWFINHERAN